MKSIYGAFLAALAAMTVNSGAATSLEEAQLYQAQRLARENGVIILRTIPIERTRRPVSRRVIIAEVPAVFPQGRIAGVTGSDLVNVRSGPGVNFNKLMALPEGATVALKGGVVRSGDSGWLPIRVGDKDGWINEHFYTPDPLTVEP